MVRLFDNWFKALSFLTCFLLAATEVKASEASVRLAIEDFLEDRHPKQTENWFLALGPETPQVMMSLFRSTDLVFRKMRLADGLRNFKDNSEVGVFFRKEIEISGEGVLKRNLLANYVKYLNGRDLEDVAAIIEKSDAPTKRAVSVALKYVDSTSAVSLRSKLKNQLPPTEIRPIKKFEE